jgi:cysteine desulfuration protein SufE
MKQPPEKLECLLEMLEGLDRTDRIQMLVDIAGKFQQVPSTIAKRPYPVEHRVPGCESEAYVWAQPGYQGTLNFYFAVENPQGISAMALAAILGDSLSGISLEQIVTIPADVVYRIFGRELSMGKSLGLMGIVNMVRATANQHLRAQSQNTGGSK